MLKQIFLFELRYRAKQPVSYIYLLITFLLTMIAFATGSVAADDAQFYNAPAVIERFSAMISILLLLPVSALMGLSLYRDIEYQSREYYLSYPITRGDYFWGRFLGSFSIVALMGMLVLFGAYAGSRSGAMAGWVPAQKVGPFRAEVLLHIYLTIILPNLFFPACLFFGLVALTRNVKVIYSGGIILLLAYMSARVYFDFTRNTWVSQVADPFAFNSVRLITGGDPPGIRNTAVIPFRGLLLYNRLLWTTVGSAVLLLIYSRFSFSRFLAYADDRKVRSKVADLQAGPATALPFSLPRFGKHYTFSTLRQLVGVELLNIRQDIFFGIVLAAYVLLVAFSFWLGTENYQIRDLPRTVSLMNSFKNDLFPYLFLVLIFYTGESVHRERSARFAGISDALPPTDWVLYASKAIGLLLLGAFLILVPGGVLFLIQWAKDYMDFDAGLFANAYFTLLLPGIWQMVALSLVVHTLINNKFAAHAAGILAWFTITAFLPGAGWNYHLLLYSLTPFFNFSDMEGMGEMGTAVHWFVVYWSCAAFILFWLGYLLYRRGHLLSVKDRRRLLRSRLTARNLTMAGIAILAFLGCGGYIYYNVSYLNGYLTDDESEQRMAGYEKEMNVYARSPLPEVTALKIDVDIFPSGDSVVTNGHMILTNRTQRPIDSLLLDGDRLTSYKVRMDGADVLYRCPLIFTRGMFDLFRPLKDTSRCRVYRLPRPLRPGDSCDLEFWTSLRHRGFCNDLYATDIHRNGTYLQTLAPILGYDPSRQLTDSKERQEFGLASAADVAPAFPSPLFLDMTIGTAGNEIAVAPGRLIKEWTKYGRHYRRYVRESPVPAPYAVLSAGYSVQKDSVMLTPDKHTTVDIYYDTRQSGNLGRLMGVLKDGLSYYSSHLGPCPTSGIRLAESSNYGPYSAVYPGLITDAEYYAWNADLRNGISPGGAPDYCYYYTARQLAEQWWRFRYRPEVAQGAAIAVEGLSTYSAMALYNLKYGAFYTRALRDQLLSDYMIASSRDNKVALLSSNRRYDAELKAGFVLYGFMDLIGGDSAAMALREFEDSCKSPEVGDQPTAVVLYHCLEHHVPDSFRYYLNDSWRRVVRYNNKMLSATVAAKGNAGGYLLTMKLKTEKLVSDIRGAEESDGSMNDYIDIGIFGKDSTDNQGMVHDNPVFLKKMRFTPGVHVLEIVLPKKPVRASIDPYEKLIDVNVRDNTIFIDASAR